MSVSGVNSYRPDVDGLRAVAVVPVLLFHAGFAAFGGGFVGVDVFFVISGYLITGIIVKDIDDGRFSILRFYERRVRRIVPALFLVIFVSTAVALVVFLPLDLRAFGQSVIATVLFVSNLWFWRRTEGYFNADTANEPLLHTWSLAVEEQFYIFFPALLFFLRNRPRYLWVAVLATILALSLASSVWGVANKPRAAFYLAPPRMCELLIGSLIALNAFPKFQRPLFLELAAMLGIGLIVGAVLGFSRSTPFPGLNALIPCAGAALIIYTGQTAPTLVGRVLGSRPFVFIGLISYSLYLWHWPILVFAQYVLNRPLDSYEAGVALIASFALAALSWKVVELPFRRRTVLQNSRSLAVGAATTMGAAMACGLVVVALNGLPQRFPSTIRALLEKNQAVASQWPISAKCRDNWGRKFASGSSVEFCSPEGPAERYILYWGDSHVEQLYPAIEEIAKRLRKAETAGGRHPLLGTHGGCPPIVGIDVLPRSLDCAAFNKLVMQRALQNDIATVVLGSYWEYFNEPPEANSVTGGVCDLADGCKIVPSTAQALELLEQRLAAQIALLRNAGKRVVLILPTPRYAVDVPNYISRALITGRDLTLNVTRAEHIKRFSGVIKAIERAGQSAGAAVFDPSEFLCDRERCAFETNGVSLYKDKNHLSADGAKLLVHGLMRTLTVADTGVLEPRSTKPSGSN